MCQDQGHEHQQSAPFPDDYFDRVLAPGGVAHILAALHAGTIGSHLHRKIYFPTAHRPT